jgi:phage terminase small subunit
MTRRAPKYLDATARAKWRELVPTLPNNVATADALAQYCVAWSRWLAASDDADKLRWSRCVRQWAAVLQKSKSSAGKKADANADPIARILRGGRNG